MEVDVVEIIGRSPFVCEALCKPNKPQDNNASPRNIGSNNLVTKHFAHEQSKQYSFDLSNTDQILYHVLKG